MSNQSKKYENLGFSEGWVDGTVSIHEHTLDELEEKYNVPFPDIFINRKQGEVLELLCDGGINTSEYLFIMDLLSYFSEQLPTEDASLYDFYQKADSKDNVLLTLDFPEFYATARQLQLLNIRETPIYNTMKSLSRSGVDRICAKDVWLLPKQDGTVIQKIHTVSAGEGGTVKPEVFARTVDSVGTPRDDKYDFGTIEWIPISQFTNGILLDSSREK